MAVTLTIPNEYFYELGLGAINNSSNVHKIILMESAFVFDPDTDGTYSDVSANEITSAGGYTVGGESLTVDSAWAQNDTDNTAEMTWVDKTLTASGAAFDTFCAGIIINDTHASKVIVGCIALGDDIDIADGSSYQFQDLGLKLALKAA